jgi:hypothetical protein
MTACHPRGFDVGYRRLNRYILYSQIICFFETMVVGPSSNGLIDSHGIFHVGATSESIIELIELHGF